MLGKHEILSVMLLAFIPVAYKDHYAVPICGL